MAINYLDGNLTTAKTTNTSKGGVINDGFNGGFNG